MTMLFQLQQKIDQLEHNAVYQQQQHLLQQQHAPNNTLLLKPTKPSEFYGEPNDNVNLWIAELTRYFAATNSHGNERTVFAIALLKKKALEWVTHEPTLTTSNARNVSFDAFTTLITTYFSPIANSTQARYDLDSLKYTNTAEFNASFRAIISRISDASESEKIHKYITKLPKKYQEACINVRTQTPTTTLHQLMLIANGVDTVHHLTYPSSSSSSSSSSYSSPSSDAMQIDMLNRMYDEGIVNEDQVNALFNRLNNMNNNPQKWSQEKQVLFQQGRCFTCGETGHRANECPKRSTSRRPFNNNNNNRNNYNNNNNNRRPFNRQPKNESSQ